MDRDTAHPSWQELSGKVKRHWKRLSDEELAQAEGDREYLLRKVHERYGLARDEIDQELSRLGVIEAPAMPGARADHGHPDADDPVGFSPDRRGKMVRGRERRRGSERRS